VILPRAMCGPPQAMARPARPQLEAQAVREAAARVPGTIQAKARAVAAQVVAELVLEIGKGDDPMIMALAELELQTKPGPVVRLATCPEIDTAAAFIERQILRLRARGGRYLAAHDQRAESAAIAAEVEAVLVGRYARHLRRGNVR
jgi:hypothetical protein